MNGTMEKRGGALISADQTILQRRMQLYCDESLSFDQYKSRSNCLINNAARFDAEKTRRRLIHDEGYKPEQIVRYFMRPFDFQYCYYSSIRPLWNESRPQLWAAVNIPGNAFLVSRPARVANPEGVPFFFISKLGDNDAIRGHAHYFPMRALYEEGALLGKKQIINLGPATRTYLESLDFKITEADDHTYSSPWLHALAIGFCPSYLEEHRDGIAVGWPRIPMPKARADFDRSVNFGRSLADLLNPDANVPSVTSGELADHLKVMGLLSDTDLLVSAGWGRQDSQGRVNPGQGRIEKRAYTAAEVEMIRRGALALGTDLDRALELLGPPIDVFLNAKTCWRCVPTAIWEYFIGGYQVIKKWLSYREEKILGRPLTKEEAREVTGIVRRLATIVLMTDKLNSNYAAIRNNAVTWPSKPN